MRTVLVTGLVVLNLVLATAVGLKVFHLPEARAQPIGLSDNYIMVSGAVLGNPNDIVYVIDLTTRQLSALFYDRTTRELSLVGSSDLRRDLGVEEGMPRPGRARRGVR